MSGVVLRDALISEAVYDVKDLPQFGQQLLNEQQLWELGLPAEVVFALVASQSPNATGLRAGIYRDYLSANGSGYVLAFAGTTLQVQDILTDLIQAAGLEGNEYLTHSGIASQYVPAMKFGYHFAEILRGAALQPRTTGHSLGGGLASAASIAANRSVLPANTFNAAGLHRNTICYRDEKGMLNKNLPAYDGAFNQFRIEQGNAGNIKAFHTEFDLLNYLQNNLPALDVLGELPRAIGMPIKLEGHLAESLRKKEPAIRRSIESMPVRRFTESFLHWSERFAQWVAATLLSDPAFFAAAADMHTMRNVLYGLMVERTAADGTPRSRKFDIFGYDRDED
jgi:hypothetical protein